MHKHSNSLLPLVGVAAAAIQLTFALTANGGEPDLVIVQPKTSYRFFNPKNRPEKVRALTFSPDGTELAVATTNGTTTFIRVAGGQNLGTVKASPTQVLFSANRQVVTLVGPDGAVLHDRGTQVTTIVPAATPEPGVVGITLRQENGKLLVDSLTAGGAAEKSGRVRPGDELLAVAPRSGGRQESVVGSSVTSAIQKIAGSAGSFVDLLIQPEGATDRIVVTLRRMAGRQTEFAVAEGESYTLVARKDCFELVAARTGGAVGRVWPKALRSDAVGAVSPDGKIAVLAGSVDSYSSAAEICNIASGAVGPAIALPVHRVDKVVFAPDGKSVYVLSATRVVKFDLANPRPVAAFNREGPIDMSLHPELFVVDGTLIGREFDIHQFGGGFRWRIIREGPRGRAVDAIHGIRSLRDLAVSSSNLLALATNANEVYVLDGTTYLPLVRVGNRADSDVEAVALSPDGQWMAHFGNGTLWLTALSAATDRARKQGLVDQFEFDEGRKVYQLTSAGGRFRAEFPAKPHFDAVQRQYTAPLGKTGQQLKVGWTDFGDALAKKANQRGQLLEFYDTLAKSLASHTNGELGEMTDTDKGKGPERRVSWTFVRDGVAMSGQSQFVHRDGRVFTVTITSPETDPVPPDEAEQWFAAFKLSNQP